MLCVMVLVVLAAICAAVLPGEYRKEHTLVESKTKSALVFGIDESVALDFSRVQHGNVLD